MTNLQSLIVLVVISLCFTLSCSSSKKLEDSDLVKGFNMLAEQKNVKSDMFAAQGYDTAKIVFSVMEKADIVNCSKDSRNKIKSGLAKVKNYQGVSGTLSFDSEGNAVKSPFISEIYKKTDGSYSTIVIY